MEDAKEAKQKAKEDTTSNRGSSGDKISLDGTKKDGSDAGDEISTKMNEDIKGDKGSDSGVGSGPSGDTPTSGGVS